MIPKAIDINIHPTKTEIKFDDEHTLYALLRSAVKHSLGQFNIAPVLDFDKDANLDTPYDYKHRNAVNPRIEVDRTFNPFADKNLRQTNYYNRLNTSANSKTSMGIALYANLQMED